MPAINSSRWSSSNDATYSCRLSRYNSSIRMPRVTSSRLGDESDSTSGRISKCRLGRSVLRRTGTPRHNSMKRSRINVVCELSSSRLSHSSNDGSNGTNSL